MVSFQFETKLLYHRDHWCFNPLITYTVLYADSGNDCWYPLPLSISSIPNGIEWERGWYRMQKWNEMKMKSSKCSIKSSSTSVCVPSFWYLLSVINTNAVYQWLHRRICLIIGDHLLYFYAVHQMQRITMHGLNSPTMQSWQCPNGEWLSIEWDQSVLQSVLWWNDAFSQSMFASICICYLLTYIIIVSVSVSVGVLSVSILLVLDWSYYNLFGGIVHFKVII